jgi:hypothetical protein
MKIKGWAWSAALFAPLALNGGLQAEEINLTSMLDEATIQQVSCCESDCCEADCCDACDCCDSCCFQPHWYAAAEFMFLGVDSDLGSKHGHGAVAGVNGIGGGGGISGSSYNDFTYAPRLTLGRELSENWGVQTRFFYLSDTDSDGQPLPTPAAPVALLSESGLRLYTIDVEAVRHIRRENWKIDATGGVRHGSLDMNSAVSAAGVFNGGADFASSTAASGSSFDGTGLTGALIGRRQLGSSRASLFTSARGSVLWGDADAYAAAASNVLTTGGAGTNFQGALGQGSTEMTIIELAIGVQWDWALRCVPANAFFRTSFEYQNWDVDDNGAAFAVGGAAAPGAATVAAASAGPAEVDLYGLVLGAGFTW